VENNKKWKEFTNLKPETYMTYKSRQYGEKDRHKLMKAIIAQKKSYNDEQEREKQKKSKEMNSKTLLGGIEGNVGNEINNTYEPEQNRMLENYVCNDIIRNDEVANILFSLNRKKHIGQFM
jgi:hypothetical protein